MPTSVRLDRRTEEALNLLVRVVQRPKSEVVRLAIQEMAERRALTTANPAELARDLIGCVSGGPPDLSQETGRKFRELLERRR